MTFEQFQALGNPTKKALRQSAQEHWKTHDLESLEYSELSEEFLEGKEDAETQADMDTEFLEYINRQFSDRLDDLLWADYFLYADLQDARVVISDLGAFLSPDCQSRVEQYIQNRDTETYAGEHVLDEQEDGEMLSAEQALLQYIIPALIKQQPGVYLRLQAQYGADATPWRSALEALLAGEHTATPNDSVSRRIIAELVNQMIREGSTIERVIARDVCDRALQSQGDDALADKSVQHAAKAMERVRTANDNPEDAAADAAALSILEDATVTNQPFAELPFAEKDPAVEGFLRNKTLSLEALVRSIKAASLIGAVLTYDRRDDIGEALSRIAETPIRQTDHRPAVFNALSDSGILNGSLLDNVTTWESMSLSDSSVIPSFVIDAIQALLDENIIIREHLNYELGAVVTDLETRLASEVSGTHEPTGDNTNAKEPSSNVLRFPARRK